jgi:hypothetical protein
VLWQQQFTKHHRSLLTVGVGSPRQAVAVLLVSLQQPLPAGKASSSLIKLGST